MVPDKNKLWHYSVNHSQVGPITFDELTSAANSGVINRQSGKVWCEGLSEWIFASSVEGLFTSPPPLQPTSPPPLQPTSPPLLFDDDETKNDQIRKFINTPLYFSFFLAAGIIGSLLSRIAFYVREPGIVMVAFPFLITQSVFWFMFVHRKWKFVEKYSDISAGQALGFLFIPFYNFYWIFRVFAGYYIPFNKMVQKNNLSKSFELDNSLGLTTSILFIVSIFFGIIPVLGDLCIAAYITIVSLYIFQTCNRINSVYSQIRANRA
jgi:hypothetical protein